MWIKIVVLMSILILRSFPVIAPPIYCSVGQSDKALLARIHTLEQEKAMLSEQVQSAQVMLRSYFETEQHRPPAWCDSNYTDSEQTQVTLAIDVTHV